MEIVSDPTFWATTGLIAASRLAVLATALWIARLVLRSWTPHPAGPPKAVRAAAPRRPAGTTMTRPPEQPEPRYVDLSAARAKQPASATARPEDASRREYLQNRLMEYLDQRATERTQS